MCTCACCAQRYLVSVLAFVGLLLSVGFRQCFSLVMTHIARSNSTVKDEAFLLSCPTVGTSHDWNVTWSQHQVQLFNTAYFTGSVFTQLPGGVLAARFSPKRVCSLMILTSSILFIILPFLAEIHVYFVYVIRALQGLVEGGSIPALAGVVSAWAPRSERSRLITLAYAGAYLSPSVGLIATGMSICFISWNSIFFIYGGLCIVWFIIWTALVYENPDSHPCLSEKEEAIFRQEGAKVKKGDKAVMNSIPWRQILTSGPVWAIFIGAFCRNWVFSMIITQQPQYFKDSFPVNVADIGLLSATPSFIMTIVVIIGGIIIDKLISGHYVSTTIARKLAQCIGFGIEATCLICLYFVNTLEAAISLLCVGVGLSGFAVSGYMVNPLDLSPQYASVVTGIGRFGTIGAILCTLFASLYSNGTMHGWQILILSAGVIHATGVILYALLASGKIQPWDLSFRMESCTDYKSESDISGHTRPIQGTERDPLLRSSDGPVYAGYDSWEASLEDSLSFG